MFGVGEVPRPQGQAAGGETHSYLHSSHVPRGPLPPVHKHCPSGLSSPVSLPIPGQRVPLVLLDQPPHQRPRPPLRPEVRSELPTLQLQLPTFCPPVRPGCPSLVGTLSLWTSSNPFHTCPHTVPLATAWSHHSDHRLSRNKPFFPLPQDWVEAGRLWESPSPPCILGH